MRHAFLIIAHDRYAQLQQLIDLLDDERNDIFVHIDKKSPLPQLHSSKSALKTLARRIDIRWGDVSQIEAELALFEAASSSGTYRYLHLISGNDMPLKSNDEFHRFFLDNDGKEFIGFAPADPKTLHKLANHRHVMTRSFRRGNKLVRGIRGAIRTTLDFLINLLLPEAGDGTELKKGANWASITNDFCAYLLSHKQHILRRYRHSLRCDEVYKQTLIWNSPFRDAIYDPTDEYRGCMRLIDWDRGTPYTWGGSPSDIDDALRSGRLFVRKTDIILHPSFVNDLRNHLSKG